MELVNPGMSGAEAVEGDQLVVVLSEPATSPVTGRYSPTGGTAKSGASRTLTCRKPRSFASNARHFPVESDRRQPIRQSIVHSANSWLFEFIDRQLAYSKLGDEADFTWKQCQTPLLMVRTLAERDARVRLAALPARVSAVEGTTPPAHLSTTCAATQVRGAF